jgi:taurine dioxygenase
MRRAEFEIAPLARELPFGSIVRGLTRADLGDASVRKTLFDLWIDRGVLVFRGESDTDMHVELSGVFGELERHVLRETWVDGHPELVNIQYTPENGTRYEVNGEALGAWLPWHSDLIYTPTINRGGILRAIALPRSGGMTGFVDKITAFDRLPARLKEVISDLHIVYAFDLNAEHQRFGREQDVRFVQATKSLEAIFQREYEYPRVVHPAVYRQAGTERPVLNISPWFALGILELGGPKGEAILREIVDAIPSDDATYFHEWQAGDMVLWDNWRTLHSCTGVDVNDRRIMQRTTIYGDYALGRRLSRADGEPAAVMV